MTNTFIQPFEEIPQASVATTSSNKRLLMLGIVCVTLCVLYVLSVRMVEAGEYTLRNAMNSRDTLMNQYRDLGTQLDSLRSLSVISHNPVLAGFQDVQKPLYLNMDAAQSVAVANGLR